jgi:hypothetical protein
MDDGFLSHHKTVRAIRKGADALQMWMALRTYVAVNTTDGDIPDEDIDDLPGAPKNPRRWLTVLVECGKPLPGGGRGAGLVDPIDGGWKLHNYDRHGLSAAEVERRKDAARERKKKWAERTSGTRSETRDGTHPEQRSGTVQERSQERVPRRVSDDPPFPSPSPNPTPGEEIPPSPKPVTVRRADPFGASFLPLGDDIARVHEAWRHSTGLLGHKLRGSSDLDALTLREAIDAHGEADCLLVAGTCMSDRKVNGEADERGEQHTSIKYVFGNEHAFARILKAAQEATQKPAGGSADDAFEAAMGANAR